MEEDGLSVDDLFNQCVFRQDERDMLLKAIRIVKPEYQPSLNMHTSQFSSLLVQDFYTEVLQRDLFYQRTYLLTSWRMGKLDALLFC